MASSKPATCLLGRLLFLERLASREGQAPGLGCQLLSSVGRKSGIKPSRHPLLHHPFLVHGLFCYVERAMVCLSVCERREEQEHTASSRLDAHSEVVEGRLATGFDRIQVEQNRCVSLKAVLIREC